MLTWVICGAGRGVGKTHLAQELCAALPDAVYAKQGCGAKRPGRPDNFFRTQKELAAFVEACRGRWQHLIIESNQQARAGWGDIVIFVEAGPDHPDRRADVDLLRSKAHLHVGPGAATESWQEVLRRKLQPPALCDAVCAVLAEHQRYADESNPALRPVEPLRVSMSGAPPVRDPGHVVVEQLLTVMVEDVGNFALLCTPCDVEALAVGFAFSEGLISTIEDVLGCSYRPEQQAVGLRLEAPPQGGTGRNLIVTSSCGLCGSRNIERLMAGDMASHDSLRVPASVLRAAATEMDARQALFAKTGGTHAAGIFDADGTLIAFGEDIGRHNALDKAIGKCLIQRLSLDSRGAVLSGRVSLELIAKAARAGIESVAAVSAPSSLAVAAAQRCNITLCAFVRGQRATIYTHPHRIEALRAQPQ
jgi:FdhD protein